eukprot:TRINITY_DN112372_c0_g1_i1.p1 TRINITY_DN112372_c0_g1~~TRINITY_DN112372_c0_g1_i1.p1  ORF type:complete len:492 (+),score=122.44 TRINITY_DN112372_c0_g1_i1:175-1476(+)
MSVAGASRGAAELFAQKKVEEVETDEVQTTKERFRESKGVYSKMAATARGARIHSGPVTMPAARKPPDRSKWVRENKQYSPYSYFDNQDHQPEPPVKKGREPPKLWLPLSAEEHAREVARKKKEAAKKTQYPYNTIEGDKESTSSSRAKNSIEDRPPWDEEHHILVSKANAEVQVNTREYFAKPKRREGEGIPKVRQLYCMNDRQCGWNDEPAPLGEPRRTYLNWVGAYNVGGPKCQQLPSYWRKTAQKTKSAPNLNATIDGVVKAPLEQNFLERLAQMPAGKSAEFWRGWAQNTKNRLPEKKEEAPAKPEKKKTGRRAWLEEKEEKPQEVDPMELAKTSPAFNPLDDGSDGQKHQPWNDRWWVTHSKDNPGMCKGHQQYFSSAQFLSGAEVGHPGAYLGLESSKWRDVAKNVSHFPVGAEGRGAIGRRCLLV